jgi:hypothetical protein
MESKKNKGSCGNCESLPGVEKPAMESRLAGASLSPAVSVLSPDKTTELIALQRAEVMNVMHQGLRGPFHKPSLNLSWVPARSGDEWVLGT